MSTISDSRQKAAGIPVRQERDEFSLLSLANVLLRSRLLILRVAFVTTLLGIGVGLLTPSEYTARAVIFPQAIQDTRLQLAGLAAQFGVSVPTGGQGAESADFYAEVVKSRDLLQEVVQTNFTFATELDGGDTVRGNLVALYGLDLEPESRAVRAAAERLANQMNVRAAVNTGLVHIATESEWPGLAVAVNERILELLEEFNVRRRQQSALDERRFVEERMARAREELTAAENELEGFLESNKSRGSAQLQLEESRLSRAVDLRQQVYTSLAQSYEQVRLEEVRNTPLFTLVEGPSATVRETGAGLVMWTAAGLLLGLALGLTAAFVQYAVDRQLAEDPATYQEFARLRGDLTSTLSSWGGLRRFFGRAE